MIRPVHDLALVKPRPDLHARMLGHDVDETGHMLAADGKTRLGNPISYKVTPKRDQFAFGEVMGLGNGTPYGSGRDRPEVDIGTIVGFDLGQVGHVLPNGVYTLMWKNMLCRIPQPAIAHLPVPLCSQVMTEPDEVAMGRLVFSDSKLILPRYTQTSGISTSDVRKSSVKLRAERVVATGPGEFVRKVFYDVGCKLRDIACYTPGGTVHVQWRGGRRLAFTPWSEIVVVLDGG